MKLKYEHIKIYHNYEQHNFGQTTDLLADRHGCLDSCHFGPFLDEPGDLLLPEALQEL